jgi:DNA mismatch endonuclease (patch repair protein)
MSDNLTKEQRSFCMSKIRSRDTKPELYIKNKLRGFIYHPKNIFGNPDFINWKDKEVIFIDGCFWHKCPKHFIEPKSNRKYWIPKLEKNVLRDKEINLAYKNSTWKVLRIWEHELK